MKDFQKTNLKNGLRIITVPNKKVRTAAVLILVGAGSKYEKKKENGISHFLEHMFFKGTKKRPDKKSIAEVLDRIGGDFNAFTSKEYTGYWAKVADRHLDLALDWVSDIFLNSKIPSSEVEKERGVILEEINMYLDNPQIYVGDLWEEVLYGDQPAGRQIIGTKENILKFQRRDLLNYFKNHYGSENTIVSIIGNFKENEVQEKIKKLFKNINESKIKDKEKTLEKQKKPKTLFHFKKTDQTHFCLGVRGYDILNPKRYSQLIASIVLGGNMSSRLFLKVREENSLAYYVHTSTENTTDTGYLVTQAGVPHKHFKKAVNLILEEYKNLREKGISKEELKKAKNYLKGKMTLNLESIEAKASFYSMAELLTGRILTLEEKLKIIDKVSLADVKRISQEMFQPENLNLAVIGPHRKGEINI